MLQREPSGLSQDNRHKRASSMSLLEAVGRRFLGLRDAIV